MSVAESVQRGGLEGAAPAAAAAAACRLPPFHRRLLGSFLARRRQLDGGCVAFTPERQRPKATVHFLGGAFVAATPHLVVRRGAGRAVAPHALPCSERRSRRNTSPPSSRRAQYSLLLEQLADAGYTCVATPYAVTFNHLQCARDTHAAFDRALAQLRGERGGWAAPPDVPTHGVGHSNGALLHALIGAVCLPSGPSGGSGGDDGSSNGSGPQQGAARSRASNILMSFNNLQARGGAAGIWTERQGTWPAAASTCIGCPTHSQPAPHARPLLQVTEAVLVPLGLLKPALDQLRGPQGRLASLLAGQLADVAGVVAQLAALAPPPLAAPQLELLRAAQQWDPALLQLGSVFDEVCCPALRRAVLCPC